MKQLWQNARCCERTYQRWTLEGRPFNGGMVYCVDCGKELHYVSGGEKRLRHGAAAGGESPGGGATEAQGVEDAAGERSA